MPLNNYLVTGGAGFIGSSIANKLSDMGHKVFVLDDLSTGFSDNLNKNIELIEIDCNKKKSFLKIPKLDYEAILHLAAQPSGEASFDNPWLDFKSHVNYIFVKNKNKT